MTKRLANTGKIQTERMGPRDGSISERLEHYSIPVTECGCHIWIGGIANTGYGMLNLGEGKYETVHRLSWQEANGPIPPGMWVLHHCDVRSCINPTHLFLGTRLDNIADMHAKGRNWRPIGTLSPTVKLSEEDVIAIRNDRRSHRKIAAEYKVTHSAIGNIKRRKTWNHIP